MNKMMETKMSKIVVSPAQAFANILKFEHEVRRSPDLQARLAYARAWYAHKDKNGEWRFGPSKFVGYQEIDAETYLRTAEESDGRRTEAQLRADFKVVDPTTALYQELSSALIAFLAKYGKTPSMKIRINVARDRRLGTIPVPSEDEAVDAAVNMMVAFAKTLPTEHFKKLRTQLEDMAPSL